MTDIDSLQTEITQLKIKLRNLERLARYPLFIENGYKRRQLQNQISEKQEQLKKLEKEQEFELIETELELFKERETTKKLQKITEVMKAENDQKFDVLKQTLFQETENLQKWFDRLERETATFDDLINQVETQFGELIKELEKLERIKNRPITFLRDLAVASYEKLENPTTEETKTYQDVLLWTKSDMEKMKQEDIYKQQSKILKLWEDLQKTLFKIDAFELQFEGTKDYTKQLAEKFEKLKRKFDVLNKLERVGND